MLNRTFTTSQPNQVWVTDLTTIATAEGKLYLCVIKDVYDGVIAAWKTGARQTTELVTSTVELAVAKRLEGERPIVHSDHGSQYTSDAYRQCLKRHGLRLSMGRVRTCADNASAESVFGQLKRELVHRCRFQTRDEAAARLNDHFVKIYNPLRRTPLLRSELRQIAELDTRTRNENERWHKA